MSSPFSSEAERQFSLLETFRAKTKRAEVHPYERLLVWVTALHLMFLPWAIGSMHVWSQSIGLALAVVGFVVALLPRHYNEEFTETAAFTLHPVSKLVRFPVFWAGLVIVLYVVVQGLNPAWTYQSNESYWWMVPVEHISWLPAGMQTPFAEASPWRALLVIGACWLLVCSVWVGFLRRRSYQWLFTAVVANGFVLALLGVLQQLAGADKILWFYESSNPSFVASFIYRNHAGPYFNLVMALAAGFAWWHYQRSQRRLEKSSPSGVFTFFAVFIGVMVVFSYSRMSTILLLAFVSLLVLAFLVQQVLGSRLPQNRAVTVGLVIVFGIFIATGVQSLNVERVLDRFSMLVEGRDSSIEMRQQARRAAIEMAQDRWLLGWGAGSFRYGFPIYQMRYPDIYFTWNMQNRLRWEHAHNDIVQFPLEFGALGMVPFLVILGYLAWLLLRVRFWRNPVSLLLVFGCTLVLVHAWADFVFQNPAVHLTWAVLLVAAARWAELDQPIARRTAVGGP